MKARVPFVLSLTLLCGACDFNHDNHTTDPNPPTPVDPVVAQRPRDETAIMLYDQAEDAMAKAPNVLARDQVKKAWDEKLCAAINATPKFRNWTGNVRNTLDDGGLQIDIGGQMVLDDDSISPSSNLYPVVKSLTEGQAVLMSGDLFPADRSNGLTPARGACDVTFHPGSFSIHLTSIRPMAQPPATP